MQELPPGAVYIIPVRLDKCEIPTDLAHLHRIDWFENDCEIELNKALDYVDSQNRQAEREQFRAESADNAAGSRSGSDGSGAARDVRAAPSRTCPADTGILSFAPD